MLPGVQRMQQPGKESHDSGWQRSATGDGARRRKCQQLATRVMGGKEDDGGKSDGDGKKGGGRAPAMAMATKERNGEGGEGGRQRGLCPGRRERLRR